MNIENLHYSQRSSYAYQLYGARINNLKQLSYGECAHFWSYGGKVVLFFRNFLNTLARSSFVIFLAGRSYPCKIQKIVTHLKLFSIVGIPFSLVDVNSIAKKLFNSLLAGDKEALTTDVLSLALTVADTIDSTSTFLNSLLTVIGSHPIKAFSAIGLPLGFMMAGTGTISRTIQIARSLDLYKKMQPEIFKKSIHERFLQGKIPKDAQGAFEKILMVLKKSPDGSFSEIDLAEISHNLNIIQAHLEKKIKVDGIGVIANLTIIFALVLFSIGATNAYPFLLMTTAFAMRLMSLCYQDQKLQLDSNLKGVL